jgi:hypothetical protein
MFLNQLLAHAPDFLLYRIGHRHTLRRMD